MSQKLPFEQMHQHEYTARVVPATCTERGYTLHVCECGEEYKDAFTPLIPHDFKPDGEVAPTCTQPGKRLFVCSVCGAKKEEPIPATGHKLGAAAVSVYPGCVSEGISEQKCALCGETVQTPIPPTGHSFGEWTDRKKAGCKNSGVRARQCEVCGKIESEKTPALGHDFSKWSAAAGDPIKEERYCLRCGMTENRNGDDAQTLFEAGMKHLGDDQYDAYGELRLAAEKGLPEAQYEYGLLLRRGDKDHKRDKKAGNGWIKKAAENGDRKARKRVKRDKALRIGGFSFLGALCVFLILLFTVIIPKYRTFVYDGTNSAAGTGNRYTKVIFKDGVTEIKDNAFRNCYNLTSVTIPDSVTSIGDYAFFECFGLTSITIPNSVTSIGSEAFSKCSGLTSIQVADENPVYYSANHCLIERKSKTLVLGCQYSVIPKDGRVTSIGNYAFHGCSGLTSITIPGYVTSIGDYAFEYCRNLTSITIPDSVTSIGYGAFSDCYDLTSVTIGNGVTSIGKYAFYNCYGLTSVTFANTSGWYVTGSTGAGSGTNVGLTDPAYNAKLLKNSSYSYYADYYWYRK